jgi:hypothetical protein
VCRISPPGHTLVPGRMPSPSEMYMQAARGFPIPHCRADLAPALAREANHICLSMSLFFECGRRSTVEKALRARKHSKCSSITISYVCHAPAQALRSLDFAWNRTCDSMTCSRSSKKASGDGLVRFSFADGERQRHRRNGRHPKSATRDERRVARRGGQDASGAHRSASPRFTNGAAIRRYCIIG